MRNQFKEAAEALATFAQEGLKLFWKNYVSAEMPQELLAVEDALDAREHRYNKVIPPMYQHILR